MIGFRARYDASEQNQCRLTVSRPRRWWETFESLRRVLMSGLIAVLFPGSLSVLLVSLLATFISLRSYIYFQPFTRWSDNLVAEYMLFVYITNLLLALWVLLDASKASLVIKDYLITAVVFFNASLLLLILVLIGSDFFPVLQARGIALYARITAAGAVCLAAMDRLMSTLPAATAHESSIWNLRRTFPASVSFSGRNKTRKKVNRVVHVAAEDEFSLDDLMSTEDPAPAPAAKTVKWRSTFDFQNNAPRFFFATRHGSDPGAEEGDGEGEGPGDAALDYDAIFGAGDGAVSQPPKRGSAKRASSHVRPVPEHGNPNPLYNGSHRVATEELPEAYAEELAVEYDDLFPAQPSATTRGRPSVGRQKSVVFFSPDEANPMYLEQQRNHQSPSISEAAGDVTIEYDAIFDAGGSAGHKAGRLGPPKRQQSVVRMVSDGSNPLYSGSDPGPAEEVAVGLEEVFLGEASRAHSPKGVPRQPSRVKFGPGDGNPLFASRPRRSRSPG
jgi:hypothetical protein